MSPPGPRRVLVIHPDPPVAHAVRRALSDDGFEVICVRSARAARVTCSTLSPDLVLIAPAVVPDLATLDLGEREPPAAPLRVADLVLDAGAHEVTRAGSRVNLTATEFRLLRCLMSEPERVWTRMQLLDAVWTYDFGGDARVLETYISYLRRKLEAHGPRLIHTVRGVGYVLRETKA